MEILRGLLEIRETEVVETRLWESASVGGNSREIGTGVQGDLRLRRSGRVFWWKKNV